MTRVSNWIQSIDLSLFNFLNQDLSNPVFDVIMPWVTGRNFAIPMIFLCAFLALWLGGKRGRLCVVMVVLAVLTSELFIGGPLKRTFNRQRPFFQEPEARVLVGRSSSRSMPSSHAVNWFAAAAVIGFFYRRSHRFTLPVAATVGFSRVYTGVHYPADVLVGAVLGYCYASVLVIQADKAWQRVMNRWFPLWQPRTPSLVNPEPVAVESPLVSSLSHEELRALKERHWMRLGYGFIGFMLMVRLGYLASGAIELSEDEAYQWLWSKRLALSYYSKPPLIAYAQRLGTSIAGDTAFGVRFLSPLAGAVLSWALFRFMAGAANARLAFFVLLISTTLPLLGVGSILMTIDPWSVLFWTLAMISGWRAIQKDSTASWCWTGGWVALGILSKYVALFQWISFLVLFWLWKPARAQLRRPGFYLAVAISLLGLAPVLWWNFQHDWITLTHLGERANLGQPWRPTLRFVGDFLGAELGLLNPVFFIGMIMAGVGYWRHERHDYLKTFLFSMGYPLFVFYFLLTLRSRVLPNWIAPSVLPMLCLMVVYYGDPRRFSRPVVRRFFKAGLVIGFTAVVLLHETRLIGKITGHSLPPKIDPLRRVRGWSQTAQMAGEARQKLLAEGRPVFMIGGHYGITSLITFYLPEAKADLPDQPLVYYRSSPHPQNQFFFWPGYQSRVGENAIYIHKADQPGPPPESIRAEFERVEDWGILEVPYKGKIFHRFQVFACRGLKGGDGGASLERTVHQE